MTRRCTKRCGLPALPGRDMCRACDDAAAAKRLATIRRNERRRTRRKYVSLPGALYQRFAAEAMRRGQSVRSLLAEVLHGV